jgi:hypothetical protein
VDNGEGSSQRNSVASRDDGGAANGGGPGSQSAADSVDERDFARRRQRVRRSGGFLLDSSFPSPPKAHSQDAARLQDAKGKRNSRRVDLATEHERSRQPHSPISSPLSREMQQDEQRSGNGRLQVGFAAQSNGELRMGKTRQTAANDSDTPPRAPQQPAIDPTQLVHMALNLSESRKRNISAGPLLASQARAVSGAQREGSFSNQGAGGSLRQYLNEQRRVSRNMSPLGGKSSPSRHMSTSMQRSASLAYPGTQGFNPSAATIARRNKARDYIELRVEYLRLLEFLPPLKLDANTPGNYTFTSNNVPGSPQAQLTRMPSYAGKQHDLGRPYNPLQYIRNRRSRARERRSLDHAPDEFADVDEVRDWVDQVEQEARHPGYRRDDRVLLPKIHDDHPGSAESSKPPRPHKGWVFCPEELLADAYWLEQSENKTILENRFGYKIFPAKEAPNPDLLQERASKDYSEKRRRSWIEGVAGVTGEPMSGGESDKGSERGRKRRLLPAFRSESPRHGKHSRRGSRLRTDADSDNSESDADSMRRKPRIVVDEDTNTGPLALQLETMLKQQSKEAQAKSPAIFTPGTPNKWGRDHADVPDSTVSRGSLEVPRIGNGYTSLDHPGSFKMPPRVRTNATLPDDDIEPRSSFDTTAPNTPLHQRRFPRMGSDMSPPPSRDGSVTRKHRRSKFNPFHSHENSRESSNSHQQDPALTGSDKNQRSRQTSEETQDSSYVGQALMAGPNAVKSLLSHRKDGSTSSLPSPEKLRRRETAEQHSAVTRFFKGVKHEGTKVSEFVFRKDRPDDEDVELPSDMAVADYSTDTSLKGDRANRPGLSRSVTAGSIASVASKKDGRYHLDLPKFRPAHEVQIDEEDPVASDHISRQNRERKNNRSPRFDRLAPPRMDLEKVSTATSQVTVGQSRSHSQERIQKVLARPGGAYIGGIPPTALRGVRNSGSRHRSSSRPTLDGKRHWSIADDDARILHRKHNGEIVTQADIARVRALFLCSGIKAKEISRRAHTKRSPPPDWLARAAAAANGELIPVPRKEEHVLAARLLMRELELSTRSLSASTQHFRDQTIKELTQIVTDLRARVDSDLMPRIFESGDTAVRITSEISGQGPLQVKQITDDIDRMLRARRRRMRWLRGFGWMLVEWALVAVMWWVWLIVVLVGSVKRVFGFGLGVVRWLLWL